MHNTHHSKGRREILVDVAHDLSRAQNIDELLDRILESSRQVMNCEVCSILLPNGKGDLFIRSTFETQAGPIRVPKGKGIASAVYNSKEVVNIRNAQEDPRHFIEAGKPVGLEVDAMLTIPLLDGDQCLGVMQAINAQNRDHFDDEDIALFETFGSLVAVTLIRLEVQKNAVREAESRQQLQLATEIQESFLPPGKATIGHTRIEAFYQPASEIGGDFYFWHPLEDDRVLLGVGDVCGKGFPASLDMARGSTLIASTSHRALQIPLNEWVNELNSRLCTVMSHGRFIACTFLLVDQREGRVSICVCGSLPPRYLRGETWQTVPHLPNPPLGASCTLSFLSNVVPLTASQKWLLYTDGILETKNPSGEFFEDRAMEEALKKACTGDKNTLETLINAWHQFSDDATYQDDTTVLTFEDLSPAPGPVFEFTCRPDVIKDARHFIDWWAGRAGFDDQTAGLIVLGCDEIFSNICQHAYCMEKGGPAKCRVDLTPEAFEIVIEHRGEGIDNADLPETEPPCAKIGGLGLNVVREVFDETDFSASESVSRIKLRKELSA